MASYQAILEWLFEQFPSYQLIGSQAYKPGLNTIINLLSDYGNPQNKLRFIHLAGTNGKGSTSSMIASVLTESGQKVGLFTSPHIYDFRERIRVDGQMISQEFVYQVVMEIKNRTTEKNKIFAPSFFEITFLIALLYFRACKCTICVIETGLGGRLDATNCIVPLLSVITNISIEHTTFLGNTLEEIAREKAGIIKQNIPVIIGEKHPATYGIFKEVAKKQNSPIYYADPKHPIPADFPIKGNYQYANYRLCVRVLEKLQDVIPTTESHLTQGVKNIGQNTGLFARMQVIHQKPLTIVDAGHNEQGIKAILEHFVNTDRLFIIYGTSSDKDLNAIFPLFPKQARYFFTEFSNKRSANIEKLEQYAQQFELKALFFRNPNTALHTAQKKAGQRDTILIFGSFFLLSDLDLSNASLS